ncbi:hypothetical protein M0638_25990 [Roseomonas sp. NAR14]|uniref:Uncharacterized protein n=1 Tax=Roseomonas acroporae TaxID=2937791 RepID=A0A9X2BWL4_9PROT|nr:hypothetical protein [Roseomonas acroporae]MCK8787812.1 hypothetical protein [Roseomonas acroporae]
MQGAVTNNLKRRLADLEQKSAGGMRVLRGPAGLDGDALTAWGREQMQGRPVGLLVLVRTFGDGVEAVS